MPQTDEAAAARRRNIESILPLAPLQEGILVHSLDTPDASAVYMPQMAYHLAGPIEPERLRAAWAQVLARHSALRSAIRWEERDEPFQVVYRDLPLPWEVFDWRGEDAQARLRALFARNRAAPFDLRQPPLIRVQLARTTEARHVLVLCFHHIILDGWSTARMLQDVMTLYHGGSLPPAPPYAEFLRWLKRQDEAASAAFWRDYLDGIPGPCLAFPGAGPAPEFARQEWAVPETLARALRDFTATQGVTLSSLLQGVLGLALARRTGREDVLFGAATAGRPASLPGATEMVGLFLNALPVRVQVDRDARLGDWLRALQSRQAACIEHEHIALRKVQEGRGTLFDCLLVIENYPATTGDAAAEVTLEDVEFDEWTHFPLTVMAAPTREGLTLILRHDLAALPPAEMEAFLASLAALLAEALARPDATLAELLPDLQPADAPSAAPPLPDLPAASTETERRIAAIWAEVLKIPPPSAEDDFFALGGHSLPAARVASRLRGAFGVDVRVRALVDRPRLGDLARHVDALRAASAPSAPAAGETVVEF